MFGDGRAIRRVVDRHMISPREAKDLVLMSGLPVDSTRTFDSDLARRMRYV